MQVRIKQKIRALYYLSFNRYNNQARTNLRLKPEFLQKNFKPRCNAILTVKSVTVSILNNLYL